MANTCTTTYKVTGTRKAVNDLWTVLQKMEVNSKNVWLHQLAEYYGIDYEKKGISARGHIYWAEFEADEVNDYYLLSFETESAWSACDELFDEINHVLWDELSISYREIECGCGIYFVHDEGEYFTEECCVSSCGEPFEDACDDVYGKIADAIKEWCSKTGIEQGERSQDEMVDFINEYEYDDPDTYFYINPFTFE
jgi:hypothetical protein